LDVDETEMGFEDLGEVCWRLAKARHFLIFQERVRVMVWNATLSALPVGATAVFRHLHFGHIVSH
jgi:hypothetical protein